MDRKPTVFRRSDRRMLLLNRSDRNAIGSIPHTIAHSDRRDQCFHGFESSCDRRVRAWCWGAFERSVLESSLVNGPPVGLAGDAGGGGGETRQTYADITIRRTIRPRKWATLRTQPRPFQWRSWCVDGGGNGIAWYSC